MALLLRLVAHFPLPLLHLFGAPLGWAVYLLSRRYRKYLKENLRSAGLDSARVRRGAIAEGGKAVLELPAIWLRDHHAAAGLVTEAQGWAHVEEGLRRGKGLIMLTPHLGCWEVAAQYISLRVPLTVMYSP